MYVKGYLQGSGNGRVVTIVNWPCSHNGNDQITIYNDYR